MIYQIGAEDLADPQRFAALCSDLELTYWWTDDWSPEFYIALAGAGFIAVAHQGYLLPELQESYAVLDWPNLRVDRATQRLLDGPVARGEWALNVARDPAPVLDGLAAYHERNWVEPRYRQLLVELSSYEHPRFRLAAVELRETGTHHLVGGELGYFWGRTYTSLTGFFHRENPAWNNAGKVQLVLLARWLQGQGLAFWNLGHPTMAYKLALGAKVLPRAEFLQRWNSA